MNQKIKQIYSNKIFKPLHGHPTQIKEKIQYLRLKKKYGQAAPKARKIYHINPREIKYTVPSKHLPEKRLIYGVIDGDWDKKKLNWNETAFKGLKERFEEDKKWEETRYYKIGVKKIQKGNNFGPLPGNQSLENFQQYLKKIDKLHEDIKKNGYDQNSIITVNIGRNGEFICHHGNHRTTISKILKIKQIPVKIKYRHKKWQEKRNIAIKNSEKLSKEEINHLDIENLI